MPWVTEMNCLENYDDYLVFLIEIHDGIAQGAITSFLIYLQLKWSNLIGWWLNFNFLLSDLQAAFCKFYGRYSDLLCQYNLLLSQMLSDVFTVKAVYLNWNYDLRWVWPVDMDAYSSYAPDPISGISRGPCLQSVLRMATLCNNRKSESDPH
jgi:hypothetical protein